MMLILTWAVIISFIIMMYIILDGFDLGIGILFLWIKDHHHRDIMMSTVTPVWDGNETWLVFGAAALYASFPLAYSTLLPILYIPIAVMLAALIFRGVAFEFRFKAHRSRFVWDIAFTIGSTLAAFMQGIILGTFVTGYGDQLPTTFGEHHWFTPFNVMVGIAVICGYALLGATWLVMRTSNYLQVRMYRLATILLLVVTFFLSVVSIWTPLHEPFIRDRWFSLPNFYYLLPLPLMTGVLILYALYCLKKRHEIMPFILVIVLFLLAYIGFCISNWPYIIPHSLSFWDAAASPSSLKFSLIGVIILLPVLLIYTAYAYRVFRGKVIDAEHHY